jgi:hypothetical protein
VALQLQRENGGGDDLESHREALQVKHIYSGERLSGLYVY